MDGEICPKVEFNPPLQLGTGEYYIRRVTINNATICSICNSF